MGRLWGDHNEHRLTLAHLPGCGGRPIYEGGTDQHSFCASGCVIFNDGDFHLPVGKLGEFTATLYEAAGLPAPVILEPPGATFEGGVNRAGRIEVGSLGGRVTVGLYGIQPEEIEPAAARRLAALIAVHADEAQSDPDPAEVQSLADEMCADVRRIGGSPPEEWRIAARAALRWFRDSQQRGERRDA